MSEKTLFDSGPILRVTTNDINQDFDGGRIVIEGQEKRLQKETGVALVTLLLAFAEDEDMVTYPNSREERQARRFRVVLTEVLDSEEA